MTKLDKVKSAKLKCGPGLKQEKENSSKKLSESGKQKNEVKSNLLKVKKRKFEKKTANKDPKKNENKLKKVKLAIGEGLEGEESLVKVKKPSHEQKTQRNQKQQEKGKRKRGNCNDAEDFSNFGDPNFDEEQFFKLITTHKIKTVVDALNKQSKQECEGMKNQIFRDFNYVLNVTCFKIPKCPKRTVRLKLRYPLVTDEDDVCLIVRDLQRGSRIDHEPTIQHYEELLRKQGVTNIKTIIPFNQLKKEYSTYEMKIKLSNLYDAYFCDGAIVGHVVGFLGRKFQKPRCSPYAVRMESGHLADEIQKALLKTCYKQGQKGAMISIKVGTNKHSAQQVVANIETVISQLQEVYPGGLKNIRNMYMGLNLKGTSMVPLYINMCNPPVDVPRVVGIREEKMQKLKSKANKILSKFKIMSSGEVVRRTKKRKTESESGAAVQADEIKLEEEKNVCGSDSDEESTPQQVIKNKKQKKETKKLAKKICDSNVLVEEPPKSKKTKQRKDSDTQQDSTPVKKKEIIAEATIASQKKKLDNKKRKKTKSSSDNE